MEALRSFFGDHEVNEKTARELGIARLSSYQLNIDQSSTTIYKTIDRKPHPSPPFSKSQSTTGVKRDGDSTIVEFEGTGHSIVSMAVCVWTVNLYGILVTEESYLKGARTHVRAQFQRNIIGKIVPGNVPTELVDQILQDSDDQARQIVNDMWTACTTPDEVARKFSFWPGSEGAELLDIVSRCAYTHAFSLS